MNVELVQVIGVVAISPVVTLITIWIRNAFNSEVKRQKREDGFIDGLKKDIEQLKIDIREVRQELKNRDEEYLKLYKEYTTLKAKYEVLNADHILLQNDHDDLKRKYENTVKELQALGTRTLA